MPCSVLVAVDESQNSRKAVEWVRDNLARETHVTLFSVHPKPTAGCDLDGPSLTPLFKQNRQAFCALEDTKKERLKEFGAEARAMLVEAGFPAKNLSIRLRKQKSGVARDILSEAGNGEYDTLVIGRRGVSGVKDFFFGSVSNNVVQQAAGITVVVVD